MNTDNALHYLADQLVELLGWWDGEWMGPPHKGTCATKQEAIRAWIKDAKTKERQQNDNSHTGRI